MERDRVLKRMMKTEKRTPLESLVNFVSSLAFPSEERVPSISPSKLPVRLLVFKSVWRY